MIASIRFLLAYSVLATAAWAAVWAPPADRVADWTPGTSVGVIGGIPVRTNDLNVVTTYGADPTGATFSDVPVLDALTAAASGDRVYFPPGTYKFQYSSPLAVKSGVTYYADPNPTTGEPDQVTFNLTNGATPTIGAGWNYTGATFTISGGLTQGSTQLTVSSSASAVVGGLLLVSAENDPAFPVVHAQATAWARSKMVRVVSVPDGTHINISPAITWTNGTQVGTAIQYAYPTTAAGFENITFNNSDDATQVMTIVAATVGCWIHNCKYLNPGAGSVSHSFSTNFQFTNNWLDPKTGDLGAGVYGFLISYASNGLIENNIFRRTQPAIQFKDSANGWVVGYNFFENTVVKDIVLNHAPHPAFQLIEGNIFSNIQTDGIYGSNGPDTIFRNMLRPVYGYPLTINRFARNMVVVGNIVNGPFSVGNPNLGNSYFSGTARPSAGDWWVSWNTSANAPYSWPGTTYDTKVNDHSGVMTMPTGGGAWLEAQSAMAAANTYFETTDGPPSFVGPEYVSRTGDTVSFVNQSGATAFPTAGGTFTVVPGSYGFQEQDQDTFQDWNTVWAGTTLSRMNYYVLMPDDTNTITASAGIPTFELIGADTLPASLYRSAAPDFFTGTGLSWPPLDPLSPTGSDSAIPAGIRYANITGGGGGGGGGAATATTVNVGTFNLAP